MGWFSKKPTEEVGTTRIEISSESRAALATLSEDVQALSSLMHDLLDGVEHILDVINGEVAAALPDNGCGVKVVEGEESEEDEPDEMQPPHKESRLGPGHGQHSIVRDSPFNRVPRHEQVLWMERVVLRDGGWHNSFEIAQRYSGDEREFRYLRAAVGGRFREMHEEGRVERRDSKVRGAMYEYRLVRK